MDYTEVISYRVSIEPTNDILRGYKIRNNSMELLHQFVDETIFLSDFYLANALLIKSILRSFKLVLGPKVNLFKEYMWGNWCRGITNGVCGTLFDL